MNGPSMTTPLVQLGKYPLVQIAADSDFEVLDLAHQPQFFRRRLHARDVILQIEGMRRLTHAFVENPETLLQELVKVAVQLCGADSAGISMELTEGTDKEFYRWVATAGEFAHLQDATIPRYPSACGVCLERDSPQIFRVPRSFFEEMGLTAPGVTDGLLLPWHVNDLRGTIWIMAHGRGEAFDPDDLVMMQVLADFTAMAVRHQHQRRVLLQQAAASAAAMVSNDLAHQINNPLQSLTNMVYLAAQGPSGGNAQELAEELSAPLDRLSLLVSNLLALPSPDLRSN